MQEKVEIRRPFVRLSLYGMFVVTGLNLPKSRRADQWSGEASAQWGLYILKACGL